MTLLICTFLSVIDDCTGKIHKGCSRCHDCSATLNPSTMIMIKDNDGKQLVVCNTHNQLRLKNRNAAKTPTVSAPASIMTEAMKRALEAPVSPSSKTVKVSTAVAELDAKGGNVPGVDKSGAPAHAMGYLVQNLKEGDENGQLRTFWEISNLTKDDKKLKELADPKLGLLAMMAKIIREDTGESRSAAIGVLWNLSVAPENRTQIVSAEVGLMAALIAVLHSSDLEAKHRTLGVLHNTSLSAETQETVGSTASMYDALVYCMQQSDATTVDRAIGVMWNLATCASNRISMCVTSGLLAVLVQKLKSTTASSEDEGMNVADKALVVIYYLSLAPENRPALGAAPGLAAALVETLRLGQPETRIKASGVFVNLSSAAENKTLLCESSLGLMVEMVRLLSASETSRELQSKICGCLWNLSVAGSNRMLMAAPELGMVRVLVTLLNACDYARSEDEEKTAAEEVAAKCCVIAQNLAGEKGCHDSLLALPGGGGGGLLRALVRTVMQAKPEARSRAFGALANLSLTENAQVLFGKEPHMFTVLTSMLQDTTAGENRSRACGVLQNLSVNVDNRVLIVQEKGLLDLLVQLLGGTSGDKLLISGLNLLFNLSLAAENKVHIGSTAGVMPALLSLLERGTDDEKLKSIGLIYSLVSHADNKAKFSGDNVLIATLTAAAGKGGDIRTKAVAALSHLAPGLKL